jgi:hypothetical protein
MRPARTEIEFPRNGFRWLANEEFQGACDKVPDTAWTKFAGRRYSAYVSADGPIGSGRFWNIAIGFSSKTETDPTRGFCLQTSTVGWRTLRYFDQAPLKWLSDENADGNPELIIWDSFPLRDSPTMAEYGLVAWVYHIDSTGTCQIDWNLSRHKAGEIAAAYRKPLAESDSTVDGLRAIAAGALEDFASGRCTPETDGDR